MLRPGERYYWGNGNSGIFNGAVTEDGKYVIYRDRIAGVQVLPEERVICQVSEDELVKASGESRSGVSYSLEDLKDEYERGRAKGREEAWDAARKISLCPEDGGLPQEDVQAIFGWPFFSEICRLMSADEVIDKLYDHQFKECQNFHIGDEVIDDYGEKWAVVRDPYVINDEFFVQLWSGVFMSTTTIKKIKKTGRTYPQIAEAIRMMKERDD